MGLVKLVAKAAIALLIIHFTLLIMTGNTEQILQLTQLTTGDPEKLVVYGTIAFMGWIMYQMISGS